MKHAWEDWKELFGNALIISQAIFTLFMLFSILIMGYWFVHEPYLAILIFEIVVAIAIIALGIDRLVGDVRRHRHQ